MVNSKTICFSTAVLLLATAALSWAATGQELEALYGKEYFKLNPHWQSGKCSACHVQPPQKNSLFLRGEEDENCLACHEKGKASVELHPVGLLPSAKIKIPSEFPLSKDKKPSCRTCHDHALACNLKDKKQHRNFLRGGPYGDKLAICYRCHDKADQKGYNPHEQQLRDGKPVENRCLFCHAKALDPKATITPGDYQLRRKLSLLCIGCHLLTPHAGAFEHLEKPKASTLKTMKAAEENYRVIFPLDEEGRLTCATCHNPHEKGVFAPDRPAGAKYDEEKVPAEEESRRQRMGPLMEKEISYKMQKMRNGAPLKMAAEPRPQKNMRLSARKQKLCKACHENEGK